MIPQHIAIIADGNRRWAKREGLTTLQGHQYTVEKIMPRLIRHAQSKGIKYLTFWVFSRENWKRSEEEVGGLMGLFRQFGASKMIKEANKDNMRVKVIGRMDDFAPDLQESFQRIQEKTQNNDGITVILAASYSGRDDITRAVQKIYNQHLLFANPNQLDGNADALEFTEELISQNLDTGFAGHNIPDPDLMIRPSGENRMSGLYAWQATYSEYYFTDKLMPEFDEHELDLAIESFESRQRRFGK